MPLYKIGVRGDLPPGRGRVVDAGARTLALFNVEGEFHAIDNDCRHRMGPLGEGDLDGALVTCPWHGWQYDVTSGRCRTEPSESVGCYRVVVEGDDLLVEI